MSTLKCNVCASIHITPDTPGELRKLAPIDCPKCHGGVMQVIDDRPLRKAINATDAPQGDALSDKADPLGVDPWREDLQTGPDTADMAAEGLTLNEAPHTQIAFEGDEPDARLVVIDGNIAYINVPAIMMTLEVDDTPEARNFAAAPVAAVMKDRGYDPVLVGLDD